MLWVTQMFQQYCMLCPKMEGNDQPNFTIPKINNNKSEKQKVEASILIPWGFIVSIAHFPGAEGFDFPSPFDSHIGFN